MSWIVVGAMMAAIASVAPAAAAQSGSRVVLADQRFVVTTAAGSGLLPIYLSADWTQPWPEATRALLIFHGTGRNAHSYFMTGKKARELAGEENAGALIIAPHFIEQADLENRPPPADVDKLLRWKHGRWKHGYEALAPAPISSFDIIDALLARLADRAMFPNLAKVVVAGHSAGGQIVQLYAIVGTGAAKLTSLGVHLRYIVANPSSYAYFSQERPCPHTNCDKTFNNWWYGMDRRPAYAAKAIPTELERAYLARDVLYLLGANDNDEHAEELDTQCMAEAEGKHRLARGHAYFDYMQKRHPDPWASFAGGIRCCPQRA
jgi:pimeloyl-ACP methyl ester carboxylesterase